MGSIFGENSFYPAPGVNRQRRPVLGAPSGATSQESQAKFTDGTRWGLQQGLVSTGPAESVYGENSFYRETRDTRLGGHHVAKRSSEPRVAYPEVKIQIRDRVRVMGIVVPFALRGVIRGKFVYRAPVGK